MLTRRTLAIIAIISVLLFPSMAMADEVKPTYLRMRMQTKICLPDLSRCVDVDPGRYVEETKWDELDTEMRRLQDQETRLTAENNSLRKSADEFPWLSASVGAVLGLGLGVYLGSRL